MYGGLFGDLPAAKGSKSSSVEESTSEPTKGNDDQNKKKDSTIIEVAITKTAPPKPKKPKNSLLFVPAAARNIKRPATKRKAPSAEASFVLGSSTSKDTATVHASSSTIKSDPPEVSVKQEINETKVNKECPEAKIENMNRLNEPETSLVQTPTDEADDEQESDKNTAWQAEVASDPYDPLVPNDLLLYWEERDRRRERERLEQEQQATMQAHRELEARKEEERRRLLESGQFDKLVAMEPRGRGRGLSNLPAWLVDKQKK